MESGLRTKLEELATCVAEIELHDKEIRERLLELSDMLKDFCLRVGITFSTQQFEIERFADGEEAIYGWLHATEDGIVLTYRSTTDDYWETADPEVDSRDRTLLPDMWDVRWLRIIATKERLGELVGGLAGVARSLREGGALTAASVRHVAAGPSASTGERLAEATSALSLGRVKEAYTRALRLVALDPPAATTAACTLLETTRKHIIEKLALEMPSDMHVRGLYKPVARALGLVTGREDLHAIANGLNTAIQSVGAFRSEAGDAHGRTSDQQNVSVEEAEFVVTAAGAVSTFLMCRLATHLARTEPESGRPDVAPSGRGISEEKA